MMSSRTNDGGKANEDHRRKENTPYLGNIFSTVYANTRFVGVPTSDATPPIELE